MKKQLLFLCFAVILCSSNTIAQTLTPTPSTVENGGIVVLTAENETLYRNITGDLSFSDLGLVTTPTGYRNNLSITELKRTQAYDNSWSKPSKFSFKITNSTQENITVTIPFQCKLQNSHPDDSEIVNNNYMINVTVTVKPTAPAIFYNDAKSQTFYKNDCGTGFESDPVTYSVPANKYSSTDSKADANSKAQAEIAANGQNKANAEGVCKQVYYNTPISSSFTKNNCGSNSNPGPAITYSVPASKHKSLISQADADAKAQADIDANGQNYANANGICVVQPYINGPDNPYTTVDYTYFVDNRTSGDSYEWIIPTTFTVFGSKTDFSITLNPKRAGTAPNTQTIKVKITRATGEIITISKTVTIIYCLNCPV